MKFIGLFKEFCVELGDIYLVNVRVSKIYLVDGGEFNLISLLGLEKIVDRI